MGTEGGAMSEPDVVTMTEIAELAQVRRPTVSNWRRRHESFPQPVSFSGGQPLFDAEEVAAWLDQRLLPQADRSSDMPDAPSTYGERFRIELGLRALGSADGVWPGDDLIRLGLALTALRTVAQRPLPTETVTGIAWLAASVEAERPELTGLFTEDLTQLPSDALRLCRIVEGLIGAAGSAHAAERLVDSADRLGSTFRERMTPPPLADFVARLAGDVEGRRVFDPAAGTGTLLLRVLDGRSPQRITAADLDKAALRSLHHRLICHGVVAVSVVQADGLTDWVDPKADLVIIDPPFAPGEDEKEAGGPLLWAGRAAQHIAPGGRAYVIVPAWTLSRAGRRSGKILPAVQLRESLLRQDVLAAVIQLPRRIHSYLTGTELAVLVLAPEGQGAQDVVVCNADRLAMESPDQWGDEAARLLTSREEHRPDVCRRFATTELLRKRSLLPAHLLAPVRTSVDHFEVAIAAQRAVLDAFPTGEPWVERLAVSTRGGQPDHVHVGELVARGQLQILPGHRIAVEDIGDDGYPVVGRDELLGARPVGERAIDPLVHANYRAAALTEPGDVIVLAEQGIHALVDDRGGRVPLIPAQVVRIPQHVTYQHALARGRTPDPLWMRPRVLARLLATPRNTGRESGSTVRRVALTQLELPNLDPDEVARLDDFLMELEQQVDDLRNKVSALNRLGTVVLAGAGDGVLTLAALPRVQSDPGRRHSSGSNQRSWSGTTVPPGEGG
jgi:predicted DNA-binding transcriptional regulator AlpA